MIYYIYVVSIKIMLSHSIIGLQICPIQHIKNDSKSSVLHYEK